MSNYYKVLYWFTESGISTEQIQTYVYKSDKPFDPNQIQTAIKSLKFKSLQIPMVVIVHQHTSTTAEDYSVLVDQNQDISGLAHLIHPVAVGSPGIHD